MTAGINNQKPIRVQMLNGLGVGLVWCAIVWGCVQCDRTDKHYELEMKKLEVQSSNEREQTANEGVGR